MAISSKIRMDATGRAAVYTFDTAAPDDLPFTAPLDHLSRVKMHSDLLTPAVLSVATYSVTLPSMGINSFRTAAFNLAAHGLAGTPLVMGRLQNGSGWIPLNGSIMLPMYALDGSATYRLFGNYATPPLTQGAFGWRSITLGADASNIVLHEQSVAMGTNSAATTHSALTLTVEVTTFDFNLDGDNPTTGTDPKAIHMGPDVLSFQRGKWRSDRRYIRTPAPVPTHHMPLGKTIEVGPAAQTEFHFNWGCVHAGDVRMRWSSEAQDVAFTASQQPVKI